MSAENTLSRSDAAWNARVELAAACRLTHLFGWTDLLATHISIRVPGRHDRYLVNPLGLLFDEVNASSILEVDLEGQVIGNLYGGKGDLNPAGTVIHGAIHATGTPEAEAVIHLHSREGVAVSCQAGGLLPLTQMSLMILGDVAYHDFQGVVLDNTERQSLLADLGNKHTLILRNHGTLSIGRNMQEAFSRIWRLERACRFQLAAQSAGVPLQALPPQVIERGLRQADIIFNDKAAFLPVGKREWAALLRRLDRELPGYRE
ncbi:MAG: class II aldolase/adducin family protein [Zoogloeaceae bacterium]|jgi:ribulose-5-phosphate 4-epimerase/fuculose-1-phosphate aldolase|nr:class II aldolase/adducin family protein [Zoogloeaceae bacterium]